MFLSENRCPVTMLRQIKNIALISTREILVIKVTEWFGRHINIFIKYHFRFFQEQKSGFPLVVYIIMVDLWDILICLTEP